MSVSVLPLTVNFPAIAPGTPVKNIETVQSTLDGGGVLLRYEPDSGTIEVRLKK